ncbi:hypothetical protein [Pyruvatibacter mobilis]|uniref:hypothetical protein n=1 Tax=Pyruvatibacter mobilis TaxID=1712261 RepID=UPI003BABE3B9
MTDEDKIAFGTMCEALLRSDAFIQVMGYLSNSDLIELANTEPHEVKKREGLYTDIRAMRRLNETLSDFVNERDALVEQLGADEDE